MAYLYLKSEFPSQLQGRNIRFTVLNANYIQSQGGIVTTQTNASGVHGIRLYWDNKPNLKKEITEQMIDNLWMARTTYESQGRAIYSFPIGENLRFIFTILTVSATTTPPTQKVITGATNLMDDIIFSQSNQFVANSMSSDNFGANNITQAATPIVVIYNEELYIGVPPVWVTWKDTEKTIVDGIGAMSTVYWCWKCSDLGLFDFHDEPEPTFPDPVPPTGGGGYHPIPNPESDLIPVPPIPQVSISNLGFLNVYKMTHTGLENFVNEVFPQITPPIVPENPSIQDTITVLGKAVIDFSTNYANKNLLDYVVDLHLIPVSPVSSQDFGIKVGYKQLDTTGPRVFGDYVDFDCGSIEIPENYGSYLDYTGTKADLYLPFIGNVPIKPEYWQDGKLQVVYRFNIIDGSCVAFVLSTSSKSALSNSVIGTYSGNCIVHLPIYGRDFATICASLGATGANLLAQPSSIGSMFGGETVGELGVAVASKIPVIGKGLQPDTPVASSYNASSGILGIRYPYLVISRMKPSWAENYRHEKGLPFNATRRLGDLHGFVMTDNSVHLDGINCTDEERKLIHDLLISGIIL